MQCRLPSKTLPKRNPTHHTKCISQIFGALMCNKNGPQIRHSNRPRKPPIIAGCNTKIALLWFNPPVLAPQCRCLHQFGSFIRCYRKPLSQMHHYILLHKYANPHTHTVISTHKHKDAHTHTHKNMRIKNTYKYTRL